MLRGHVFKFQTFANEVFAHFIHTFLCENMGITKGCALSNTSNSVSIGAGYFCVYGRFLEIIGYETISDITNTGYYRLICEIDLSKINTKSELNQASVKIIRGTNNYPALTKEDLDNGGNIYQYEFARFRVTENGITDFSDTRTYINLNSIYTIVQSAFTDFLNTKNNEADNLLQQIQNELDSIVDRSGLVSTNGGTINGNLQITGTTTSGSIISDNLKKANGKRYINIEDIKVLTGNVNVNASANATVTINYPSGFNKNNCVPISLGLKITDNKGYNYVGYHKDSGSLLVNAYDRKLNLLDSNIQLIIDNDLTSAKTVYWQLVLMKIS